MQSLKIKKQIDSEILYLPEFRNLIGKNVEIIILEKSAINEKISEEKKRILKDAYDSVFSDESVCKEQLDTAVWFEGSGNKEGEKW